MLLTWQHLKLVEKEHYQHFIVSPEQLGMYNGYLPQFAQLLQQNQTFVKQIQCIHIDEAHNIFTASLPHHGEDV